MNSMLVYGIKLPFELNEFMSDIVDEIQNKYDNIVSFNIISDETLVFGVVYKTIDFVYEIDSNELNKFTDEFMDKTNDNINIFKMLFKKLKDVIEKIGVDNITLPDNLDFTWFIANNYDDN